MWTSRSRPGYESSGYERSAFDPEGGRGNDRGKRKGRRRCEWDHLQMGSLVSGRGRKVTSTDNPQHNPQHNQNTTRTHNPKHTTRNTQTANKLKGATHPLSTSRMTVTSAGREANPKQGGPRAGLIQTPTQTGRLPNHCKQRNVADVCEQREGRLIGPLPRRAERH